MSFLLWCVSMCWARHSWKLSPLHSVEIPLRSASVHKGDRVIFKQTTGHTARVLQWHWAPPPTSEYLMHSTVHVHPGEQLVQETWTNLFQSCERVFIQWPCQHGPVHWHTPGHQNSPRQRTVRKYFVCTKGQNFHFTSLDHCSSKIVSRNIWNLVKYRHKVQYMVPVLLHTWWHTAGKN